MPDGIFPPNFPHAAIMSQDRHSSRVTDWRCSCLCRWCGEPKPDQRRRLTALYTASCLWLDVHEQGAAAASCCAPAARVPRTCIVEEALVRDKGKPGKLGLVCAH